MKEHKNKKNAAHRKIILKLKTHAFHIDGDGKPVRKGSFKKGRILKIDTKDFKVVDGKKLYRAMSVSHKNIYIACTKKNCERLSVNHIKNLAKQYLKKKKKMTDGGIRKNLRKASLLMAKKIESDLNKSMSNSEGLSYYDDDAFDYDDGFCFEKENSSDLSFTKGGAEELYEEEVDIPQKSKYNPLRKLRGTGEGVGFSK
jgi:hypothetical protein